MRRAFNYYFIDDWKIFIHIIIMYIFSMCASRNQWPRGRGSNSNSNSIANQSTEQTSHFEANFQASRKIFKNRRQMEIGPIARRFTCGMEKERNRGGMGWKSYWANDKNKEKLLFFSLRIWWQQRKNPELRKELATAMWVWSPDDCVVRFLVRKLKMLMPGDSLRLANEKGINHRSTMATNLYIYQRYICIWRRLRCATRKKVH